MTAPSSSPEVRARLVRALDLDLVGPGAGHELAHERLPGWIRPSNWYLTGFLIPSGTPPEKAADDDEEDELGEVPESGGLLEEDAGDQRAAKKGYFPSSIGLSFLVAQQTRSIEVHLQWGDYAPAEVAGADGPIRVWQRTPRAEVVSLVLDGSGKSVVRDVPGSGGLQVHLVERPIEGDELRDQIPPGTRSVSVFLVNHRTPDEQPHCRWSGFRSLPVVRSASIAREQGRSICLVNTRWSCCRWSAR